MNFAYVHLWWFVAATLAGFVAILWDAMFYSPSGSIGIGSPGFGPVALIGWFAAIIGGFGLGLCLLRLLILI